MCPEASAYPPTLLHEPDSHAGFLVVLQPGYSKGLMNQACVLKSKRMPQTPKVRAQMQFLQFQNTFKMFLYYYPHTHESL